jgi:hypothetical protein
MGVNEHCQGVGSWWVAGFDLDVVCRFLVPRSVIGNPGILHWERGPWELAQWEHCANFSQETAFLTYSPCGGWLFSFPIGEYDIQRFGGCVFRIGGLVAEKHPITVQTRVRLPANAISSPAISFWLAVCHQVHVAGGRHKRASMATVSLQVHVAGGSQKRCPGINGNYMAFFKLPVLL